MSDADETEVMPEADSASEPAPAKKKRPARRGRTRRAPAAEANEDIAGEVAREEAAERGKGADGSDSDDDGVTFHGIETDQVDEGDGETAASDSDGSEDKPREGREKRGRNRNNRKDFNGNNKNNRNKRSRGSRGDERGGKQDRGNRQGKQRKARISKNGVLLADGTETDAGNLSLGDLLEWDVIADADELAGFAAEFAEDSEPPIDFQALYPLPLAELKEAAVGLGCEETHTSNRAQLLRTILEKAGETLRLVRVEGLLEVLDSGHGLLTFPTDNYRVQEFSVVVPECLIRKYSLMRGHWLEMHAHPPRAGETAPFAVGVLAVNGADPVTIADRTPFTELTPYYPTERLLLETSNDNSWDNTSMRVVDLLTPIGLGQRGLIVAPPRTGKTVLMQGMANAIAQNRPEAKLLILLVDERPEEVTDFKRNCQGEVVASTFDETADSHVHAAEMVIEKARRLVEGGEDVVILLDSITRLARAYNTLMPSSGKILSGGVEANAMQRPKRFFGSARNIEEGGSLTIIGTTLVETGSRMDEVIFEEFKGTGNMELVLDRALVDKRIFPALSFEKSGTRKEELLYHPDEMNKIHSLRRAMKGVPSPDAMEMLIKQVKKTKSNAEYLMSMSR